MSSSDGWNKGRTSIRVGVPHQRFNSSYIRNYRIFHEPGSIYSSQPGERGCTAQRPQNNSLKQLLTQKRGKDMGKLNGKVAVITAATSGMALATAKLFVEEGASVFITGRRQDKLDEAVKLIGKNVIGVQGYAAILDALDRHYETVM